MKPLTGLVAVAVAGCVAWSACISGSVARPGELPATPALTGPQPGTAAPAFSLKTLDGKTVSLDSYKGKTLVINVWATWCPPCRQEMPDLIAGASKLAKDGVAFLGVDTTEEAGIVRAYAVAKDVPYPLALDADKAFSHAYDIAYFPTTFVIDPSGVLRARYIDVLGPAQLAGLVRDAKDGKNGAVDSPLQRKIDATLADPALVFTAAEPATIEATAVKADAAIASAKKMLDESDAAKGNATDLLRTRSQEAALRDRAIAALVDIGTSVHDTALLPRLRGDAALDREQWQDALDAYHAVLNIDPANDDALSGISLAAGRLEQYDVAIEADRKRAALQPSDATILVDLALAQAKAGHGEDAYMTFDRARAVARAAVDADPGSAKSVRRLAYVYLYAGRTYAKNGEAAAAREQFEQTLLWTQKLPPSDARHDMYLEEGQEALAALGISSPTNGASVSLVPWTGAELPGSIPNTLKYRLVVAGRAGRSVDLRAAGVPKGWVASFCSDRVCAPFKVSVTLPESGLKILEFQLIAPQGKAPVPRVRVLSNDGSHESFATT